jgi:hypothetical protein
MDCRRLPACESYAGRGGGTPAELAERVPSRASARSRANAGRRAWTVGRRRGNPLGGGPAVNGEKFGRCPPESTRGGVPVRLGMRSSPGRLPLGRAAAGVCSGEVRDEAGRGVRTPGSPSRPAAARAPPSHAPAQASASAAASAADRERSERFNGPGCTGWRSGDSSLYAAADVSFRSAGILPTAGESHPRSGAAPSPASRPQAGGGDKPRTGRLPFSLPRALWRTLWGRGRERGAPAVRTEPPEAPKNPPQPPLPRSWGRGRPPLRGTSKRPGGGEGPRGRRPIPVHPIHPSTRSPLHPFTPSPLHPSTPSPLHPTAAAPPRPSPPARRG